MLYNVVNIPNKRRGYMLSAKEVAELLNVSIQWVRRVENVDPTFPKGIRLSKRAVRWRKEDIEAWLTMKGGNDGEAQRAA